AIGCNQSDDPGSPIDVGVAATVYDDFVPALVRESSQVGMGRQRPIRLLAQEETFAARDDEHAAIRQPIEAEWEAEGSAHHDLALAIEIDGHEFPERPSPRTRDGRLASAAIHPSRGRLTVFPLGPNLTGLDAAHGERSSRS